jgi:phage protein D
MSTLSPKFSVQVAGITVDNNVSRFMTSVSYESADGMADALKLSLINPDNLISDAKIFQPGNEVSLFLGYKEPLKHIGRAIIQKQIPNYPEEGIPTLSVVGYTKDSVLADNSPEESKKRRFRDYKYSDAVSDVATRYGMTEDIDITNDKPHNWFQKSGVSDYELVQGLANLTGFTFWIDGDENGEWTLHFRDPETITEQETTYTFRYNDGDNSNLLGFRPELLVKGSTTKLSVVVKDRKTSKVIKVDVEEENNSSPDVEVLNDPTSQVDGEYTTGSDIKLYFENFAFEVFSNKRFKDEDEARIWAEQWFRRQRENFILASGSTIGSELLMARQKHLIENVSPAYNGEYFFSKVKHILDNQNGYRCQFNARRLVP